MMMMNMIKYHVEEGGCSGNGTATLSALMISLNSCFQQEDTFKNIHPVVEFSKNGSE